jgi:hypothetical protein
MEILIILGFVVFAVFSIFGVISMLKQINRLPDKNKKPNPKMVLTGVDENQPFVKTRKRKPKTTKEWEDEFDLGGHE